MSLCPHGYTAFWDCPICEEPMGTVPSGTMNCPVCGKDSPHYHDLEVVNAARSRLAREMGLGTIAAEIVNAAMPAHGRSVYLPRALIQRLGAILNIPLKRPDLDPSK